MYREGILYRGKCSKKNLPSSLSCKILIFFFHCDKGRTLLFNFPLKNNCFSFWLAINDDSTEEKKCLFKLKSGLKRVSNCILVYCCLCPMFLLTQSSPSVTRSPYSNHHIFNLFSFPSLQPRLQLNFHHLSTTRRRRENSISIIISNLRLMIQVFCPLWFAENAEKNCSKNLEFSGKFSKVSWRCDERHYNEFYSFRPK